MVYLALRRAILDGRLHPGAPLREEEISRQFKVSRTPVREALKKLEVEALIAHQGRSLVVDRPTADEVMHSYEIRAALAALASRLAAERATESDLIELELLEEQAERATGPVTAAEGIVTDFDRAIWKASKNPRLARLLEDLQSWQNRFTGSTLAFPGRLKAAVAEHRELLEAIRARNVQEAERVGLEHMRRSRDTRIRMALGVATARDDGEVKVPLRRRQRA